MEVRRVLMTDPEVLHVLDGWAAHGRSLYGDHEELYAVEAHELEPPDGVFIVLMEGETPVAGGGFRRLSSDTCEIKRMWTDPGHRRKGHASAVLDALEMEARRLGYSTLRLETGPAQPEARSLYERRYRQIPAYNYQEAFAFEHSL